MPALGPLPLRFPLLRGGSPGPALGRDPSKATWYSLDLNPGLSDSYGHALPREFNSFWL